MVAFLEYGGDREYYLASAADRVFLLPTSPLDLTGIASYEIFLRGALDKMGAYPDFVHIGAYKTAVNQFTEKGFTPEHREMTESLNRDLYDQLVRGIAEARKKTPDEVRRLLDEGPFTPEAARQAGLVDELAYLDQLDDRVAALKVDDDPRERVEEERLPPRQSPLAWRANRVAHRRALRLGCDHLRQEHAGQRERRRRRLRHDGRTARARSATTIRSRRSCCAWTVPAGRRSRPT